MLRKEDVLVAVWDNVRSVSLVCASMPKCGICVEVDISGSMLVVGTGSADSEDRNCGFLRRMPMAK